MKCGEMVLAVYGMRYCQKFELPPVSQEQCTLVISRELFGLAREVVLHLEVMDGEWCFQDAREYSIHREKEVFFLHKLRENEVLMLNTLEGDKLLLIAEGRGESIPVFEKISLSREETITIGSSADNRIRYQRAGLVSHHHARLERIGKKDWVFRDIGSSNGSFYNHVRIQNDFKQLSFGDQIEIYGLRMIFLGELLALESCREGAFLHTLTSADAERIKWMSNLQLYEGQEAERSEFYNCPTRKMPVYLTDPVEIEGPPAPGTEGERSLFLTIGPSLTMAVPMLAGVIITGLGGLGIGLVTMLGSAGIGAFWAYMNLKAQKKKTRKEEERRFQMYSDYLKKKEAEIAEISEKNLRELQEQYPEAEVCASYDTFCGKLWNRNENQSDFLFCRLGSGTCDSLSLISIPKERFTLIRDTLADEPSRIQAAYQLLKNAPIGINLDGLKLLGIIGGENKTEAWSVLRTILVQMAASVNYLDMKFVFLCDERDKEQKKLLDSVKWFPHIWETGDGEENQFRYAAGDAGSAAEVLKRIGQIIKERQENGKGGQEKQLLPRYILFVLEPGFLRDTAAEKALLDNSPYVGVTTVICTERFQELPNTCGVYIEEERKLVFASEEKPSSRSFTLDRVSDLKLNEFSHSLAAVKIRRIGHIEKLSGLVTFFDLYGVRMPEELKSEERWKTNRIYKSMRVPFGLKEGNSLCCLDIHDGSEAGSEGDGPHGLVAGTTGSGKSETLQSVLLSLALNFSPEDLSIFIIDYKGGGMGNLFNRLPHLQGQISNLSGRDIDRALVSLRSELVRRQRIFEENGVTKIDTYIRRYKNQEIQDPMPHLVLVIDEFAELKKEKPEFMREVVRIATIGRSLGVHLILSTQKPGGVVDETINSNMNFWLCLRVASREDSRDMLHRDDAVYITQTGRGYLKVGEGKTYELFQSAWSGAPFGNASGEVGELARMYKITGETILVGDHQRMKQKRQEREDWIRHLLKIVERVLDKENLTLQGCVASAQDTERVCRGFYEAVWQERISYPKDPANTEKICSLLYALYECRQYAPEADEAEIVGRLLERTARRAVKLPEKREKTQLDAVVEYLAVLGERYPQQHKLWLPVLPQMIPLSSIQRHQKYAFDGEWKEHTGKNWTLEAVAGMIDDPENQQQNPLILDFTGTGHWAIYGAVGSGKSTFLQTVIYALLSSYRPDEVQVYGIDYSSRMMLAFQEAPGMGTVICENQPEKLGRFFHMLRRIMKERKELLAGGTFSQYVQAHKEKLPAVVVALDQYSAFREKTQDRYQRNIQELIKEGASLGVYLILTANSIGSSELPLSLAEQIRGNVSLAMNDRYQYQEILKTGKTDIVPDERYRGRGLLGVFGRVLEFQTAVAVGAEDDYQRMELIRKKCGQMAAAWTGRRARQVPEIPENPTFSQFAEISQVQQQLSDDRSLPIGYDMVSGEIASLDLSRFFCYLIAGRRRTGKSNFLQFMIRMAAKKGGKLCVIDGSGNLERLARETGAAYLKTPKQILDYFYDLMPKIQERNKEKGEFIRQGLEEAEMYQRLRDYENIFIFISSLQEFTRLLYEPKEDEPNMHGFFETLARKGRMHKVYFFAEYDSNGEYYCRDKEFFRAFVKEGTGILFGGMASEQDFLDFSAFGTMAERNQAEKPGIGWTASGDGLLPEGKIVVPLAGK